jgi:SSS family solute:Na+ symporter
MAASVNFAAMYPLAIGGWTFPSYIALTTLVLNLALAVVLTPVFNAILRKPAADETLASDYAM